MPYYCVNKNAQPGSNDHEVHDLASLKGCLPAPFNRQDLGYFSSCSEAVAAAKRLYWSNSDGCAKCVPACHTS